jgi:hypothetical protein
MKRSSSPQQRRISVLTSLLLLSILVMSNIATHVLTLHAPAVDGFHSIGWPFAFHRCGGDCHPGDCGAVAFHPGWFAADAAFAIGMALSAGWIVARLRRRSRPA